MRTENKTRPELLSFTDFMSAFRAQYEYGPMKLKKKFSVSEQMIHKNNKDLHGLIVRVPGNKIAPVFSMRISMTHIEKEVPLNLVLRALSNLSAKRTFLERSSVNSSPAGTMSRIISY